MEEKKTPIISIKDIWKSYGKHEVLKGLSLDVFEGETLVILGKSGVGKSVLLKQLMGIEAPDKGKIYVRGQEITKMSETQRYKIIKHMGILFQGAALFDSMTISQNTGFYLSEHEDPETGKYLSENQIQERVKEALSLVDLKGVEDKMPSELSGGMRKRAGIARLIVYRPRILLYDEPTAGLDPITSNTINELILMVQRKFGASSIVVTHDLPSALKVGDRLALHNNGAITQIAPKDKFFEIDDPLVKGFFENATLCPIT